MQEYLLLCTSLIPINPRQFEASPFKTHISKSQTSSYRADCSVSGTNVRISAHRNARRSYGAYLAVHVCRTHTDARARAYVTRTHATRVYRTETDDRIRERGLRVQACASARSNRGWEFGLPRVPTPSLLHQNSDTT